MKTAEDITHSNEPQPPQDFRGFRLHRVVYIGASPPIGQVALPHLQGKTVSHWAPTQKQVLTPELKEAPQLMVALSAADTSHWNIVNDPIFPSCLDEFKARHEASQASGAAKLTRRPSSHRESSTPTHELPLAAWPQPPSTPTLEWREVDEKVAEVMDQVHNLHLETVQEMGFIRAIDQALAKSVMVEFLRLKLITGDNPSTTLWTWQANMEATTEQVPRGSQAEAGSPTDSTGCSPLGDEEIHSIPSQGAAVSAGDKASGRGAFLEDYRPSKQGVLITAQ